MDSSTPSATEPESPPTPRRELLDTVAAQVAALDQLVALARRSIRVFDIDLSQMGWNSVARSEALSVFLRRSKQVRFDVAVHDTHYIESQCSRLQLLHQRYGHVMTFAKTGPAAKAARDPLVIVDDRHFLHRYDFEQARATLGIEQPDAVKPLLDRFNEIWQTRESNLPGTLLGI